MPKYSRDEFLSEFGADEAIAAAGERIDAYGLNEVDGGRLMASVCPGWTLV